MTHISPVPCCDPLCPKQSPQRLGLWARLQQARALRRQRRALSQLSEAQLRDVGLTRDEAIAESRRAAWDVPGYWQG